MTTKIDGSLGVDKVQDGVIVTADLAAGCVTPDKTQAGALPSMIRLNTANGYGSVNTMIRRFTNIVTSRGTDITYADSATLGASFTISVSGVYAISYQDSFSSYSYAGISLNSSQLSTSILDIARADTLAVSYTGNGSVPCSTTLYLEAGSIIRPHAGGVASASDPQLFTIARVA